MNQDAHQTILRGDLYYADLSPVVGSEQGGIRPVLVIQNDVGNKYSPCLLYTSKRSLEHDIPGERAGLYYVMMNLLFSSLLALIYTNDLFTAYVFIEINTIAACAIVCAKESGETVAAAIRYLIMSLVGSGLILKMCIRDSL